MHQKTKLIVALVVFLVVIAGASIAYNVLSGPAADQGAVGNRDAVGGEETAATQSDTDSLDAGAPQQGSSANRQPAPDFAMLDSQGTTVKLSDLRGQPVVLNFWASWCPPCREEMPEFEQLYQEYGTQVQFVMLNATDGQRDTVQSAAQFINEAGFSFPVYFDDNREGARAFSVNAIPVTVFIDRDGYVAAQQIGMISKKDLLAGIALIR
ncbi:MAG: TlpA family protein disulfide reductase [Coriobacteriales bacterium]|jgi:thiol-disulfide isomerase/thioredoxin|nr:TlpA family protein disulfide reductase [Coriobacteriales bacterium]